MSRRISDIGVAMIGTGFMGVTHVEALRRVGVRVVGVLGSSLEKSRAFAEQWSIPTGYASLDELLDDSDVHAVHIGTPNKVHFEQTKRSLEAGKHVLCEKPLAMTSAESAELVALAGSKPDQVTGVNYNLRFFPLVHEMRERVRGGEVGDLFHITGGFQQDWLHQQTDYNWRVLASEGGELRAISDIGTHWLDMVHAVTELEVESVCADLQTVYPVRHRPKGEVQTFTTVSDGETEAVDITTDDAGSVLIRFVGGARGTLHVSQTTAGRKCFLNVQVAGSKTAMAWNSESPNDLFVGRRDRANETLIRDPSLLTPAAAGLCTAPGGHNEGYCDTHKQCFKAFYEYIVSDGRPDEPPFATFADGHRELALCEAILQSHRERRWVDVGKS